MLLQRLVQPLAKTGIERGEFPAQFFLPVCPPLEDISKDWLLC
jgi:hypothetical protein